MNLSNIPKERRDFLGKVIFGYINREFKNKKNSKAKNFVKSLNYFTNSNFFDLNNTGNTLLYSLLESHFLLSKFSENSVNKKEEGIYYTGEDTTDFMILNSIKLFLKKINLNKDKLILTNEIDFFNLKVKDLNKIIDSKIFDPTCGSGEFLISAFKLKIEILKQNNKIISDDLIIKIVKSLFGNDLSEESLFVSMYRVFSLATSYVENIETYEKLSNIVKSNFFNIDFVNKNLAKTLNKFAFDIIVGNPPYVEYRNYRVNHLGVFGNIYADIMSNSIDLLKVNGITSFVIPLSYSSTIRMSKLRTLVNRFIKNQLILSFSDRPGALFPKAHQKLNIFIGEKSNNLNLNIWTSSYLYWKKMERQNLFKEILIFKNNINYENSILKIESKLEENIMKKIFENKFSIFNFIEQKTKSTSNLYLSMRASFWIKAFSKKQKSKEYKELSFKTSLERDFFLVLLNSSLFWMFWVKISDCWHITKKELIEFKIPTNFRNFYNWKMLSEKLMEKLDNTKKFIYSKQTDFEYKHKLCKKIIDECDDVIGEVFGLTQNQIKFIKNYSLKYRINS